MVLYGINPENELELGVMSIPACSTAKEYANWLEVAALKHAKPNPKTGFCGDCTKDYQAAMVAEHRCANPIFSPEKDKD